MRLHILSDLHLEFGPVDIPPVDADVVLLAGDIHAGNRRPEVGAKNNFPTQPVIYVLGNQERYRHSLPGNAGLLKAGAEGTNICVLENNLVEIGGITFLGCTLWTDFQLTGNPVEAMRVAEHTMSDYHVIRFNPEHRPLQPQDTARVHAESVAWLRRELPKSNPARTVVVTHHSPSTRSETPYHANSPLKPAFASNLDSLVEQSRVPLWIYGHNHYNGDFKLGSTRVLSNQRGYPDQLCEMFEPGLVIVEARDYILDAGNKLR